MKLAPLLPCIALLPGLAAAQGITPASGGSRLLATGGGTAFEGAAGGGLVPWAVLSGYGDRGEASATAFGSVVRVDDYALDVIGASVSIDNRVELSVAKQRLDIDSVAPGETLEQSVIGMKLRLGGELVYDTGPQWALGVQLKSTDTFDVPQAVGAAADEGVDVYLSASKLWLHGLFGRSTFLNGTVRATRANQTGLLGFGTTGDTRYRAVGEVSAGVFLNRRWVVGAEYRQKPDRLAAFREDDWRDVFVGWFPNKHVSVIAAFADLGSIAGQDEQRGAYLSVELAR